MGVKNKSIELQPSYDSNHRQLGPTVREGYHSWVIRDLDHFLAINSIFLIPKGENYYKNDINEQVSSNIIYICKYSYFNLLKLKLKIYLKNLF